MKLFKTSNRITACILLVMMLFAVSPVSFASVEQYPAYEFVVTADKISVQSGDTFILTITVNGPARHANALQYNISYSESDFTTASRAADAFESEWYADIKAGEGFGAINRPGFSNKNGVIKVNYIDSNGECYVDSDSTSEIVGKIVFTAVRSIDDVSSCFTLSNAKHAYGTDEGTIQSNISGTIVQLSDTIAVQKVKNLIAAIGTPVTYSSKAAIEAARSAYDAITSDSLKAQVTNLAILTDAEAALKVRTDEMDRVKGLIDTLDSTKDTFENDIETAETAFNALANDEKAALTDYAAKIQTAKDKLAQIKQEQLDRAKAAEVDALILAIGDVTLENGQAILDAQNAYNELSTAQRGYVENYDILEKAANDYGIILAYWEAAVELENSIKALPDPEDIDRSNAEETRRDFESVNIAYNGVVEAVRNYVSAEMRQKLLDVEKELKLVEAAVAEAQAVEALIDDLGEISLASKNKLDAIATKLEEISDKAKGYITSDKMSIYDAAWERYEELEAEEARVQAVIDEIAALGDIKDIILEDKEAVEAAEAAFAELGETLQQRVKNAQDLKDIRTKLNALIASKQRVDNVINLINQIGEVEFTSESKAKIDSARSEYDRLTDAEKDKVDNYSALEDAENLYEELSAKAEQEEKDQNEAGAIKLLIDAIGTVELKPECEAKIIAAEQKYYNANSRTKELVGEEHYNTLTQARAKYDSLKADKEAIDSVIAIIDAIGTVTYDDDCLARIQAAEKAYDELDGDLKSRVTNADKIQSANDRYAKLKAEDEAINNVIDLIEDIGEVSATEECLEKITKAREAYNALEGSLKERVKNIEELVKAEKAYKEAILVINSKSVENYGADGKFTTVVTNVSEGMIVSCGADKAVTVTIGENVYHVFVTDHEISDSDIALEEGTPAELMLGDIDGKGTVTATDALMVCKYVVGLNTSDFESNPMKFVKADVDGNGRLNVVDALMIATAALNDPNRKVEFTILTSLLGIE